MTTIETALETAWDKLLDAYENKELEEHARVALIEKMGDLIHEIARATYDLRISTWTTIGLTEPKSRAEWYLRAGFTDTGSFVDLQLCEPGNPRKWYRGGGRNSFVLYGGDLAAVPRGLLTAAARHLPKIAGAIAEKTAHSRQATEAALADLDAYVAKKEGM